MVITNCNIGVSDAMLQRQEERNGEGINITREHSSPLDGNCHQQEVFRDVNM